MAQDINTLLDEIIQRYQPGGGFGKAALGVLETRKGKTLAKQQQSLVSAGLGGSTIGAGFGKKFEEDVGTPFRLGVEEQRLGALTQAMQAKAGYLERGEEREFASAEAKKERDLREFQSLLSNRPTGPATPAFPSGDSASMQWQAGGGAGSEGGDLSSFADNYQVGGGGGGVGSMGVYGLSTYQDPTLGQQVLGQDQIYIGEGRSVGGTSTTQAPVGQEPTSAMTSITLEGGRAGIVGQTKTVQVPASALGSGGPGGFKDEATYLRYVPSGWHTKR